MSGIGCPTIAENLRSVQRRHNENQFPDDLLQSHPFVLRFLVEVEHLTATLTARESSTRPFGRELIEQNPQPKAIADTNTEDSMEEGDGERAEVAKVALLQVYHGETEVERRAFSIKEKISIGRNPYTDICLEDSTVSRLHAEIERDQHELVLYNRSANGTIVNGKAVARHVLGDGDVISVGSFKVVVEIHPDSKSSLYDEARAEGLTMDEEKTISCARKVSDESTK
jgi:pSer/pThr/pTyr-binding forkhead associated (FHA) protein